MELYGFMLANYAETNRGLLYVQGGGWEFATVSEIPAVLNTFLAGHIVTEPDSALEPVALNIALEAPGGDVTQIASAMVSLHRNYPVDGELKMEPVQVHLPLPIGGGGRHAVLLSAEGTSSRIPLFIRMPPDT